MLFIACAPKRTALAPIKFQVLLDPLCSDDYLQTAYAEKFNIIDLKRISKSENRWSLTTNLSPRREIRFLKHLEKDTLVEHVGLLDSTVTPPNNSTNVGYSKSKPIRNQ
jgi:hypothetical protein